LSRKTTYELLNGRKPNISHLRVFGCSCFVLNNGKENLGKFDEKADMAFSLDIPQIVMLIESTTRGS